MSERKIMSTRARNENSPRIMVRLERTYPDGPVAVSLASEASGSSGWKRLGLFTEFALRRRLADTQERTRQQVNEIMRDLLREPYEREFAERFHGSWGSALDAWIGVGTLSKLRWLSWTCRRPGCPDPIQRTAVAAFPDQVVLLRCPACGSLRRVDQALPEEGP